MTILLLAGSPVIPSRSSRLLQYAGKKLASLGHRYDMLHVRDLCAEALLHAEYNHVDIKVAVARVKHADAIVVATPVYKASCSGILKAFLDVLPQDGLAGKLVLPLATGGSQSHMLALDYALRPMLSSLGARHVLPSVFATDAQLSWETPDGLTLDPAIGERLDKGLQHLSESLNATRHALTNGFDEVPFSRIRCSV